VEAYSALVKIRCLARKDKRSSTAANIISSNFKIWAIIFPLRFNVNKLVIIKMLSIVLSWHNPFEVDLTVMGEPFV